MSKKPNYFEDDVDELDARREKRKKKNKRKKAGKSILAFIATVVILLALGGIIFKAVNPSFDFKSLIPSKVMELFVKEEPTTEPQTEVVPESTTLKMLDYIEFDDFDFNTSVQGNGVGNLLNGGLVATDLTYTYHYVRGEGIYRLAPSTESYSKAFSISDSISCINLRGNYIYYINDSEDALYRVEKGTQSETKILDNVNFAYVYDNTVYCTSKQGKVIAMDLTSLVPVTSYYANGDSVKFVGISLSRVFFTVLSNDGQVRYYTIDNYAHSQVAEFRKPSANNEIKNMMLENGFFYFYQKQPNGEYNLCRQKYGSENIVTLVKGANADDYAEINSNRLYFSTLSDELYCLRELNMNSGDEKIMLATKDVKDDNELSFYIGDEYNFIIGNRTQNNDYVCYASSIYTSSAKVMHFDGGWSY